jgi:hypothetical protein
MKKFALAAAVAALASPVVALDKMPDESGWSGFVNLGVGSGSIESNFLARLAGIDLDLGDDTIDDFGSPDDESITTFAGNINVNYTFSNLKTQVSIGNDLADFLQFDRSTVLSLRHDFDTVGRLQISALSAAFPQTEVWEDPYLLNESRDETERDSTGVRLTWDKIFGSQFEVKVQTREIELDEERSGQSLVADGTITAGEASLLDREGDHVRAEVGYLFNFGEGTHLVRPSVTYIDKDLDGDAMAQDGYQLGVSWLWNMDRIRWVNNVLYETLEGDEVNPIFDEVNDADSIVFASQMFFPGLFGLDKWEPNVSVLYGDYDSDIDFNDAAGWMVNVQIGRQF